MTNLKENILQTVVKNKISMIPRWKFFLYSMLWILSACFSFALLVFFGSLIMYVLSVHGFIYLPFFKFGEVINSLRAIPFILFILTIVLLFVVEILVRNYAFSFRKSIVTTFITLTLVALCFSYLLNLTPVHREIWGYAKSHHISFISKEYDRPLPLRRMGLTVIRGVVISTSTDSVVLELPDDSTQIVYGSTTLGKSIELPEKGEEVVVFGQIVNNRFEAVDIRTDKELPF
jgi:hypothetical protein